MLGALLTLWLLLTIGFLLLALAPAAELDADDPRLSPADRARHRVALGLDGPWHERYAQYLAHAARGELGFSLRYGRPVAELVGAAFGPTVQLGGAVLVVAFALGWWLGTIAATRHRGWPRWVVDRLLPALDALPAFWVGMMGVMIFAHWLDWLPSGGAHDPMRPDSGFERLRHLILPALTLGVPGAAVVARHHAAAVERALQMPSTRTARCLGVPERRLLRAAIRASVHPSIVLFGLALPVFAGGTAVIEEVFSWPGLGRLQIAALLARDVPLALGGLLVMGLAVLAGGALAEALALWLDPRWAARQSQ